LVNPYAERKSASMRQRFGSGRTAALPRAGQPRHRRPSSA
jgi:hypothetical protein